MTHDEFVESYRNGCLRVDLDRKAAGRFVSERLLLPLVRLPVLGIGTALALTGWVWTGLAIIGVATLAPIIIKRSAAHFVMTQVLQDETFYAQAIAAGVLTVQGVNEGGGETTSENGASPLSGQPESDPKEAGVRPPGPIPAAGRRPRA
jgi:hypothetical protein